MRRSRCVMPICNRFQTYISAGLCDNCHHVIWAAIKRMGINKEIARVYRSLDLLQREAKDYIDNFDGRKFTFDKTIEIPTANHTIQLIIKPV